MAHPGADRSIFILSENRGQSLRHGLPFALSRGGRDHGQPRRPGELAGPRQSSSSFGSAQKSSARHAGAWARSLASGGAPERRGKRSARMPSIAGYVTTVGRSRCSCPRVDRRTLGNLVFVPMFVLGGGAGPPRGVMTSALQSLSGLLSPATSSEDSAWPGWAPPTIPTL
jgi:hypothetical protein